MKVGLSSMKLSNLKLGQTITVKSNIAYDEYFQEKLAKYGVKSPAELSESDKKKFFEDVDKEWKSKEESKEVKANIPDNKWGQFLSLGTGLTVEEGSSTSILYYTPTPGMEYNATLIGVRTDNLYAIQLRVDLHPKVKSILSLGIYDSNNPKKVPVVTDYTLKGIKALIADIKKLES